MAEPSSQDPSTHTTPSQFLVIEIENEGGLQLRV
jgi:hypothetical protein